MKEKFSQDEYKTRKAVEDNNKKSHSRLSMLPSANSCHSMNFTVSEKEVGHVGGEIIKTQLTRLEAKTEKEQNRVEERFEDLHDDDIEYLIDEAKIRLKTAKLKNQWEKRTKTVSYANLQGEMISSQ